jgi:hypothetical protein
MFRSGVSGDPGGRPRGAHCKRNLEAIRLLKKLKFDPLSELITLAQDPSASRQDRITIATTLMAYAYPRLKSIDVELEERLARLEERLNKLRKSSK